MAAITAAMVKDLRQKTDAPMMECKKALVAAEGDFAKAEEILRVKLGNKANKAAARVAAEGIVGVYVSDDRKLGALFEVNSETDFVAKNPDFVAMAETGARLVAEKNPADIAALSALTVDGKSLEEIRTGLVGKIGENMSFRRFVRVEAQGRLDTYVHGGAKIAAMVDMIGGDEELAHDVAMHIAASKPKALDENGVPAEMIESERRIAIEKARESGKPENLVERIAEGSVKKFLKEVTLLNQPFVKDDKITVGQLLKSKGATCAAFYLFVVGEGIEKKTDDFAAEVAAQVAASKQA
ncbi:MAG: elongation factor Ts [Sutterella sp.]|uniref:translation elongation factor Ts n=1 Tax=Dakarella massiliensis TaxID=1506471 RepID=UPI00033A6BA5|nr:translation elongation factor Ts [Dakarella massiliensis]MBS6156070.1 elongation factor Ts [Sutterella sp.]CDE52378.1 elongation factor Ts [Sutterella sp. CAG:351]